MTSSNQTSERIDADPFPLRGVVTQIKRTPRAVFADQTTTSEGKDCFSQDIGIVVATTMHALRCVLGNVPCSVFAGVTKPDVDNEGIGSDLVPRFRERALGNVGTFGKDMQVNVPAVITATTLDLDEVDAAMLATRPEPPTT